VGRELELWAFDTEDDGHGGWILGGVTNGKEIYHYKQAETMRRALEACPPNVRLVAHNLEYDLGNLYRDCYGELDPTWNRASLISARVKGKRVRYWDSMRHAPISLAKMGKIIGLEKKEIAYHKMRHMATEKVAEYLDRDCEILWRFMDKVQRTYLSMGGELKSTLPSSALNLFKAWKQGIYCAKPVDEDLLEILKTSYYGGRTEAFYRGNVKKAHYSDVHSMYPWTMLGNFPNFHVVSHRAPREGECGIIEATVSIRDWMPPLPYKSGKLTFPEGKFRGTWTREEIDRMGVSVDKIHGGITFPVTAGPILADYVKRLYDLRLKSKGDEFGNWFYKLLMNSLYGKFAASPKIYHLFAEDEFLERTEASAGCICAQRKVWDGSLYLCQMTPTGYPVDTNYIWSSIITGRARIRLWEDAHAVMKRGGKIYYTDTDSLIYSGSPLENNSELGRWGTDEIKDLEIKGPKMYRIGDEYTVKGVPAKGMDEYGHPTRPAKDFFTKGKCVFRRPVRMREALKRRAARNPRTSEEHAIPNYWVDIEKVYGNKETKRLWEGETGWSKPLVISETGR